MSSLSMSDITGDITLSSSLSSLSSPSILAVTAAGTVNRGSMSTSLGVRGC